MSFLLVSLLYAMWSSSFPLGKMIVAYSSPVFITSIRMLFGGSILLLGLALFNRPALRVSKRALVGIVILALFSVYATNLLEFYSLRHLSAAKTCFLYSLSPFFAALFSFIHFNEKMTRQKLFGMCIGVIALAPAFIYNTSDVSITGALKFLSISTLPELAVCAAAALSVYGWVVLRIVVKDENLSPFAANGYSMALGGTIALVHATLANEIYINPIGYKTIAVGIAAMTLISNIICSNLYGYLLKKYTATFLSFCGLLSPFFTSITSYILLGEPPSLLLLSSTLVLCIGLYIVYRSELTQGYVVENEKMNALS